MYIEHVSFTYVESVSYTYVYIVVKMIRMWVLGTVHSRRGIYGVYKQKNSPSFMSLCIPIKLGTIG